MRLRPSHRLPLWLCVAGLASACWAGMPVSAIDLSVPDSALASARSDQPGAGLPEVLRSVMRNHPAIKGKQAEISARGAQVESAEAGRYPTLSGQANNMNQDQTQSTLRLQQPLWAFGKIDTAIDHASAELTAEQHAMRQVRRKLIEESAAAYARVEGVRQRIQVAKTNMAEHDRLYQRIKQREQGQLASQADVRLALTRVLLARAQKERIDGELLVAINELQSYTLTPVATDVPVDPLYTQLPVQDEAIARAQAKDADVIYKRSRLDVVQMDIKREQLAPLPTLYFRVEHDLLDTPVNIDRTRAGLVIEGSLDGMGLVSKGRVKGAQARSQAAEEDLAVALNDIKRRVGTLMVNRDVQTALIRTQEEVVQAQVETMASFIRQYDSGLKSWMDVLNTQRELTEQRLQLAQLQNDWLILSLRVAALTGELDSLAGVDA